LSVESKNKLSFNSFCDIVFIITDGLSAQAVEKHAQPVLSQLLYLCDTSKLTISPLCIVQQGRVAISDEIGMLLQAKLSVILIGERPGLSSPHSMGMYITYKPVIGLTDESRNCISNIHPNGGISYSNAASQAFSLIQSALTLQLSGVKLKPNKHLSI
jgi:ethanolamine ammonia-lyase small subunit